MAIYYTLVTWACGPRPLGRLWGQIGFPELARRSFGMPEYSQSGLKLMFGVAKCSKSQNFTSKILTPKFETQTNPFKTPNPKLKTANPNSQIVSLKTQIQNANFQNRNSKLQIKPNNTRRIAHLWFAASTDCHVLTPCGRVGRVAPLSL